MEAPHRNELSKTWLQLLGGCARQAAEDGEDAVLAMLGEGRDVEAIPRGSCEAGDGIEGMNFL